MSNQDSNIDTSANWDAYWQGSSMGPGFAGEGVQHPVINDVMRKSLQEIKMLCGSQPLNMVDLASGKGVLTQLAREEFGSQIGRAICVDTSFPAVRFATENSTDNNGVVADTTVLPFVGESQQLVMSRFGIEYSGFKAFSEAVRIVASGGFLLLLLHYKDGLIYKECKESKIAVSRLIKLKVLPLAKAMLKAGFAALKSGNTQDYKKAFSLFIPKFKGLELIMDEFGVNVAGGMIREIYHEIAHIQNKIQYYDSQEVLDWIEGLDAELSAYKGRMGSMCEVALDQDAFNNVCGQCVADGFKVIQAREVIPDSDRKPLGWLMLAHKVR